CPTYSSPLLYKKIVVRTNALVCTTNLSMFFLIELTEQFSSRVLFNLRSTFVLFCGRKNKKRVKYVRSDELSISNNSKSKATMS
ncbi:hypothetical protein, partial [Lysinibacillus xylanilyticus]|uniref:hypothetical protein n=1 Tax=Lysinibacillus xylanilyticus TaxID=582475 RepID=UPI003CFBF137